MDSARFDAWTRRRIGLGLGALAVGLVAAAGQEGVAKKKPKKACTKKQKAKCRQQDRACEKGKCVVVCNARNSVCRGNSVIQLCGSQGACDCSPLAEGGFACAAPRPETCPGASECATDAECAADEVCVDASGDDCCGSEGFGLCRKRCKEGNPGH